ncbi:hypothetical protein C479_15482 [Halovivax asiaticus JCM 14624]|uniref:Uncharacterized protein n=1 Tax=Halovivax asiaticus JCM 14624 TaxID=1227490 RepID=M0BA74_9EURY|nr:hypothetical protein [Halovivax asiaticus]ELZ07198.1 hypothetical protein C479_15482 [Halovivax asiaticus JCM 14624]
MSVHRGTEYVRRTGRRTGRLTTAFWVAVVDAATIGGWFTLLVLEPRTLYTALAGLAVLCFGAVLRTGFVASSASRRCDPTDPRWLFVSALYAAIWVFWLLTAEALGGRVGVLLAGGGLVVALLCHFAISTVLARPTEPFTVRRLSVHVLALTPALSLAVGATAMLGIGWLAEPATYTTTAAIAGRTIVVELHALVHGGSVLACCSFVGTHRLLSRIRS